MRVLRVILSPETGKISVRVAVQAKIVDGVENEAFVEGALEITPNAKEGKLVRALRSERITCTLMDGKSNIRAAVTTEVEKHPNDTGIVEVAVRRFAVKVATKSLGFCRDGDATRHVGIQPKSLNDTFRETNLGKRSDGTVAANIDSEEAFRRALLANIHLERFHLLNKVGDGGVRAGVNQQVVDVDDNDEIGAEKQAGIKFRRREATALKTFAKVGEEVSRCLLEAVERSIETENQVVTAHETSRLGNINFLLRRERGVDKCSRDIALSRTQLEFGGKNHHRANSRPLSHRGPSFEVIHTLRLAVATDNKPGLELLDAAVGVALAFEGPGRRKDLHAWSSFNVVPAAHLVVKGANLHTHGIKIL
mmetsp:Transcript_30431/g.69426  ORF Transcript_30431/g.69426 Transcript_30431/m.69426 type:complete len:365 (+) Transcript_30431:856-1950(+)